MGLNIAKFFKRALGIKSISKEVTLPVAVAILSGQRPQDAVAQIALTAIRDRLVPKLADINALIDRSAADAKVAVSAIIADLQRMGGGA